MESSQSPQCTDSAEIANPIAQNFLSTQRAPHNISQVRDASSLLRHFNPGTQGETEQNSPGHLGGCSWPPTSLSPNTMPCKTTPRCQRGDLSPVRGSTTHFDTPNKRGIHLGVIGAPLPCWNAHFLGPGKINGHLPSRICLHCLLVYKSVLRNSSGAYDEVS